jgi:hypothetical protein
VGVERRSGWRSVGATLPPGQHPPPPRLRSADDCEQGARDHEPHAERDLPRDRLPQEERREHERQGEPQLVDRRVWGAKTLYVKQYDPALPTETRRTTSACPPRPTLMPAARRKSHTVVGACTVIALLGFVFKIVLAFLAPRAVLLAQHGPRRRRICRQPERGRSYCAPQPVAARIRWVRVLIGSDGRRAH